MSSDRPRRSSNRLRYASDSSNFISYLFNTDPSTLAQDSRNDSSQEPTAAQPGQDRTQQLPPLRSLNRSAASPTLGSSPQAQPSASAPPLPITDSSRPTPSSQRSLGYRSSRRPRSTLNSVISTLDEIGHDLDYANSHLRSLLDFPAPDFLNSIPPNTLPAIPASLDWPLNTMASRMLGAAGGRRDSSRTEESGRLNKRRKLDSEKTDTPPYTAFHYGRYGQVEPGALTMEIVSCDGGLYSDGSSYAAENILKNDNSVYCTKGNRCNIVLQHQGCTTFSLKELIIKAPGKNYSSPVKEGMVFLSMSKDELVQAEQYQSNAINAFRRSPLFEYLEANQWRHRPRDARDDEDDEAQARNSGRAIRIARDVIVHEMMDNPTEVPFVTAPNQPAFHVLTECSEDEDDETPGRLGRDRDGRGPGWRSSTTGWSPTPLRNRPRRRLPVYDESTPLGAHLSWEVDHYRDSEDEDDDNFTELYDLGNATISSPDSPPNDGEGVHVPARPRADRERRDRDSAHNRGGDQTTGGEASSTSFRSAAYFENRSQGLSALRTESPPTSLPRAEFHIEPHKNKCTIVFDPPVTARYILLKMWNPRQDMGGNIDIQGVVAKGFAGPRYFPAMELR